MLQTLAISWPGPFEMMLLAGLGLLIFGKRLPEVGRNIGKGIVEFKRGLKSVEDDVAMVDDEPAPRKQISQEPGHKFDPYTGKPLEESKETSSTESEQHHT